MYFQTSDIRRTLIGNRRSNHIFIIDLTPGFSGLGKDNCKTRRETSKCLGFRASCIKGLMGMYPASHLTGKVQSYLQNNDIYQVCLSY